MKKVLLYIGIALAAIGCTKSEFTEETPTSGEISFSAGVTTRVDADSDCAWESNDKIGIFIDKTVEGNETTTVTVEYDNLLFEISNTSTGAMTNKSGKFLEPDGSTRSYYAYYPYLESSEVVWSTQGYVLNFDYTIESGEYEQEPQPVATDQSEFLLWASVKESDSKVVALQFTHMFPKVTFKITAGGLDVTSLADATVTLKGANSEGTFGLKSGEFTITDTEDIVLDMEINDIKTIGTIIAYLPPVAAVSGNVELWITADGNTFIYPITTEKWESGSSYEYDITLGEVLPIVDYSSKATVNNLLGTSDDGLRLSNCYMVDPACYSGCIIPVGSRIDTYWIDSEYGNYSSLRIEPTSSYSHWTSTSDMQYTIVPLWNDFGLESYDDKITFTKVLGDDDYPAMKIEFPGGFRPEGNMVVAVQNNNVTIWSWHIWITDYNPYTKTNGTTYTIDDYGTWMDRNIGARSTAYSADEGNLYYQWGRKDPLTSSATAATAVSTIADAVKAPEYFYLGTSSTDYDWCGSNTNWEQCRAYHWRDAKLASTQAASGDKYGTTKSIYDPSPLGFMVPTSLSTSSWSSPFAFIGETTYNSDYSFSNNSVVGTNGITFPASGTRFNASGELKNVGSRGYYWSATPSSSTNGYLLDFFVSEFVYPSNETYRSGGFPVRPVQE